MARPAKVKVDYFPHVTHTGKTIAILEARWGNDGYAFWFKLLELLGDSNDFAFNCNLSADWEYLLSKTRVTDPVALAILNKLAEIGAIDADCWTQKIVWSDHFVRNLESVFEKRKRQAPQKPEFPEQKLLAEEISGEHRDGNSAETVIIPTETDKLKERKVEESKAEESEPKEPEEPETACAGAGAPEGACVRVNEPDELPKTSEELSGPRKPKRRSRPAADIACPSRLRPGVVQQADTVFLTPQELAKLRQEYGEEGAARMITILDAYKTNHPAKGAKYRNDYKCILSWGVQRYREETGFPGHGRRASPLPAKQATFNEKLAVMAMEVEE
ncbi:MAG: hypothetical protein AB9917_22500 [Negativicutes bacterium]